MCIAQAGGSEVLVGNSHLLRDDLAGDGPQLVQVGIPELIQGLVLEPALDDQETVDDASLVVCAAGLLGRLNDLAGDDLAVRTGNLYLI
jgi:hypothetical protein